MNAEACKPPAIAIAPRPQLDYLNESHGLGSWLFTTDHKRIGILFLISILFFFAIAAVAAALMRLELITPEGDLVFSDSIYSFRAWKFRHPDDDRRARACLSAPQPVKLVPLCRGRSSGDLFNLNWRSR